VDGEANPPVELVVHLHLEAIPDAGDVDAITFSSASRIADWDGFGVNPCRRANACTARQVCARRYETGASAPKTCSRRVPGSPGHLCARVTSDEHSTGHRMPAEAHPAPDGRRWDAFISYAQVPDGTVARALRGGIQAFGRSAFALRRVRVFLDESAPSPSSDLPRSLTQALAASREHAVSADDRWLLVEGLTRTILVPLDPHAHLRRLAVRPRSAEEWSAVCGTGPVPPVCQTSATRESQHLLDDPRRDGWRPGGLRGRIAPIWPPGDCRAGRSRATDRDLREPPRERTSGHRPSRDRAVEWKARTPCRPPPQSCTAILRFSAEHQSSLVRACRFGI